MPDILWHYIYKVTTKTNKSTKYNINVIEHVLKKSSRGNSRENELTFTCCVITVYSMLKPLQESPWNKSDSVTIDYAVPMFIPPTNSLMSMTLSKKNI
jgi:hypothetical protein